MGFSSDLSNAQVSLTRAFEAAGIITYSQAVKAFKRRDNAQIEEWKAALKSKREAQQKEGAQ